MAKRKKSRADGEGSIYQRADGGWIAQVQFIGADGARRIARKVSETQGEARRKLTEMKGDQDAHRLVVGGKATVRNWLDLWLEEFIKPNRAPQTYCNYYHVLRDHVPARLANIALTKVAPEDIQRQLNLVAEEHPRTADLLRSVLRASFNKAVKLRRMPSNPALGTDPVRPQAVETPTFTMEEGLRFLQAAEEDRLGPMFTIMLSLGLREGEATGLKSDDVDLDNMVLHVRRSLQWSKMPGDKNGHWIERPPKQKSRRDLPITATIRNCVIRHMTRRQEEAATIKCWKDSGYLFTSVTGAPLHPRNVLEAFHNLCDAANVPRIRVHDTRHSAGTLLHAQGADPFVIQRVLGHSQISTTRRYVHVPIEVTKTAVAGLESGFEAERKKQQEKQEKDRASAADAKPAIIQEQSRLIQ